MATAAQVAANRLNGLKAKGSKSPSGRAASSLNAVKHGLAGSTTAALMAAGGDRDLLDRRKVAWGDSFDPQGEEEQWLFERLVAESIRVDRCGDAYFALCRAHGRRASSEWDADRRREADEKALGLAKAPHLVARRIEATPQGCDLMLDYWRGLSASLERHRTWTDAQRSLALDLLGVHPDLRDAATPIDPAEGGAFEARRAVVGSEIARLEALRDGDLAVRDAEERAMAEATLGAELTKSLQLMHRYERAAWRRQEVARRLLDAARRDRDGSTPDEAKAPPIPKAVAPPPAPRPVAPTPPDAPKPSAPVVASSAAAVFESRVQRATAGAVLAESSGRLTKPSPALNRHERRAQAAMARKTGR